METNLIKKFIKNLESELDSNKRKYASLLRDRTDYRKLSWDGDYPKESREVFKERLEEINQEIDEVWDYVHYLQRIQEIKEVE